MSAQPHSNPTKFTKNKTSTARTTKTTGANAQSTTKLARSARAKAALLTNEPGDSTAPSTGFLRVLHFLAYPIFAYSIFLGVSVLVAFIPIHFFRIERDFLARPIPFALLNIVLYALICPVTYLVETKLCPLLHLRKPSSKSPKFRQLLGLSDSPTWTDVGLGLAGFVASLILAALAIWLCSFLPFFDPNQAQNIGFGPHLFGPELIFAFLALVIVAPVVEELLFRGWLYARLRQIPARYSILISSLLTSLIFALAHRQLNVGVNVFMMSLIACSLREFTGTTYAGIFLHIFRNWLSFMLLYVFHLV